MNKPSGVQLRTARSLVEFLQFIEEISPTTGAGLWFRGQSNAQHRLTPGVLRETTPICDGLGRAICKGQVVNSHGGAVTGINAERMLAAFKRQASTFLEGVPTNDFEWMFIAQHHGVPTRLLDWSTNALVALFFAVSEAESREECEKMVGEEFVEENEFRDDASAVYIIDPGAVNEEASGYHDPIDIADNFEDWKHYLNPTVSSGNSFLPICVLAPHMTSRIRAQSGIFTLHGENIWPVDYYDALRPLITKIFIPFTATNSIRESLDLVGISHSFIYPSLDTIASDIARAERQRHNEEKLDHFESAED